MRRCMTVTLNRVRTGMGVNVCDCDGRTGKMAQQVKTLPTLAEPTHKMTRGNQFHMVDL